MAVRIESSRLVLEPLSRSHLQNFHRIWSDEKASFWSLRGRSKSVEDSEKLMEGLLPDPGKDRPDHLCWTVYDKQHACVGIVNMWIRKDYEPGQVEPDPGPTWVVAYMFLPAHWGKGYATESVEAMISGARTAIQPCTLQAYINPANPPSAKVARKLGFELVEHIFDPEKPKVFVGGEWRGYNVERFTRKLE